MIKAIFSDFVIIPTRCHIILDTRYRVRNYYVLIANERAFASCSSLFLVFIF